MGRASRNPIVLVSAAAVLLGATAAVLFAGSKVKSCREQRRRQREYADPTSLFPITGTVDFDGTRFVACWSPRGGTGKTSVAVALGQQLSWGLARQSGEPGEPSAPRVLVIDIDGMGDSTPATSSEAGGPRSLLAQADRIDGWESLRPHLYADATTGLSILRPADPSLGQLDSGDYARIVDAVSPYFSVVIFDCGPASTSPLTPYALARAHRVLIVGDQTFPTVIQTVKFFAMMVRHMEGLPKLAGKEGWIYLVNRYDPKAPSPLADVAKIMDRYADGVIPLPRVPEDESPRSPLASRSLLLSTSRAFKLAIRDLADTMLAGLNAAADEPYVPEAEIPDGAAEATTGGEGAEDEALDTDAAPEDDPASE